MYPEMGPKNKPSSHAFKAIVFNLFFFPLSFVTENLAGSFLLSVLLWQVWSWNLTACLS